MQHCLSYLKTISSTSSQPEDCKSLRKEKTGQMISEGQTGVHFKNWAETYACEPELYFEPTNVEEIQNVLKLARMKNKRVKVVGNGHSPSDIACTDDYMISLKRFKKVLQVDIDKCTVKVEGGILLSELNKVLDKHGLAIKCLGSVSDITVAGCIGSGTHGTGKDYGILGTYVLDIDLISASGEIIHCDQTENTDIFNAARCHLGALGVIVNVTLQVEPAFNLHDRQSAQNVDKVLENLDAEIGKSEHFRMGLFPHLEECVVWHNSRTTAPPEDRFSSWFWDYGVGYHFLEFVLWISTFFNVLVPLINKIFFSLLFISPRERIGKSYKVFNFECLFKQYVTEWAIPREKAVHVLREMMKYFKKSGFKAHFPVEVRFVKGDEIFLSPCYGRDSCLINIISYRPYNKLVPHDEYWKFFEGLMYANEGRPHWAKKHKLTRREFEKMYPKFKNFLAICKKLDPDRLFSNAYLDQVLYS